MAASKGYYATTPSFRFLDAHAPVIITDSIFELEESDVWTTAISSSPEFRKPVPNSRSSRKNSSAKFVRGRTTGGVCAMTSSSLPVNVPDWSKILKEEYHDNRRKGGDYFDFDEEEEEDVGDRIPPHEFLARTRIASFSVHEGVGRTLKGRDLSRVRNEIWEKTGFED